jgi:hypothetical protein
LDDLKARGSSGGLFAPAVQVHYRGLTTANTSAARRRTWPWCHQKGQGEKHRARAAIHRGGFVPR